MLHKRTPSLKLQLQVASRGFARPRALVCGILGLKPLELWFPTAFLASPVRWERALVAQWLKELHS